MGGIVFCTVLGGGPGPGPNRKSAADSFLGDADCTLAYYYGAGDLSEKLTPNWSRRDKTIPNRHPKKPIALLVASPPLRRARDVFFLFVVVLEARGAW